MNAIQQVEVNGVTVRESTEFELQGRSEQLAEDIIRRAEDIHSKDASEIADELIGETLTVVGITRNPSGTHFELTTRFNEDNPASIMQFAIENMLQDGDLEVNN